MTRCTECKGPIEAERDRCPDCGEPLAAVEGDGGPRTQDDSTRAPVRITIDTAEAVVEEARRPIRIEVSPSRPIRVDAAIEPVRVESCGPQRIEPVPRPGPAEDGAADQRADVAATRAAISDEAQQFQVAAARALEELSAAAVPTLELSQATADLELPQTFVATTPLDRFFLWLGRRLPLRLDRKKRQLIGEMQGVVDRVVTLSADAAAAMRLAPLLDQFRRDQQAGIERRLYHLDQAKQESANRIGALASETERRLRARLETGLQSAAERRDTALVRARSREVELISKAQETYRKARRLIVGQAEAAERRLQGRWSTLAWDDPHGSELSPPNKVTDTHIRIGSALAGNQVERGFALPALFPTIASGNTFIVTDRNREPEAITLLNTIALRAFLALPPEQVRLVLFDPAGAGENLSGFIGIHREIRSEILLEPRQIEAKIEEVTGDIQRASELRHNTGAETFREYNARALKKEPYRILLIVNFPNRFNEKAIQDLLRLSKFAGRGGGYILATIQKDDAASVRGFSLEQLTSEGHVVEMGSTRTRWNLGYLDASSIEIESLPEHDVLQPILEQVNHAYLERKEIKLPFDRVAFEPDRFWTESTTDGIDFPIGMIGANEYQHFVLGRDILVSALVIGTTRIGKSNLLHVIITSIATRYSPNEVELYLLDFKEGVEFADYARHDHELPHARVIAMESERELGHSVLRKLQDRVVELGSRFRKEGVSSIEELRRKHPELTVPRIVLIVDEFQKLFEGEDGMAVEIQRDLNDLARRGGACGIHVILASQNLSGSQRVARGTISEMAVRIVLKCSDSDARAALADNNNAPSQLMSRGEAFYNDSHGVRDANRLFKIFFLPRDERVALLDEVNRKALTDPGVRVEPPVVFHGDEVPGLSDCEPLRRALTRPQWAPDWRSEGLAVWLGKSVAIKPPTEAQLGRRYGAHLVVLGNDLKVSTSLLVGGMLAIATQVPPGSAVFHIVNAQLTDPETSSHQSLLSNRLPHEVMLYGEGSERSDAECLDRLHEVLAARRDGSEPSPLHIAAILGAGQAPGLRDADSLRPSETKKKLVALLDAGSRYGIHFLISCDTYTNFTRATSRDSLRHFGARVAQKMELSESNGYLGVPTAYRLSRRHVLFWDHRYADACEKLFPYALPPLDEFEAMIGLLREREAENG